jgi:hypothetical protein
MLRVGKLRMSFDEQATKSSSPEMRCHESIFLTLLSVTLHSRCYLPLLKSAIEGLIVAGSAIMDAVICFLNSYTYHGLILRGHLFGQLSIEIESM